MPVGATFRVVGCGPLSWPTGLHSRVYQEVVYTWHVELKYQSFNADSLPVFLRITQNGLCAQSMLRLQHLINRVASENVFQNPFCMNFTYLFPGLDGF